MSDKGEAPRAPPTAGAADAEVAAQLNAKLEQLRGRLHADMEAVVQARGLLIMSSRNRSFV